MDLQKVIAALRAKAEEANQTASKNIGIDDFADVHYQGVRNGFIQAIQVIEETLGASV